MEGYPKPYSNTVPYPKVPYLMFHTGMLIPANLLTLLEAMSHVPRLVVSVACHQPMAGPLFLRTGDPAEF